MTLATILEHAAVRQGELVLAPALTEPSGQPGERSRPPLDADATCHAVTGPKIPDVPNRAVTAAVAAPNATSGSFPAILILVVLLPVTVLLRRADAVEVIGAALTARAAGLGHRRIAVWLGASASTVRGWLRRWAARLAVVRAHFTVVARLAGVDQAVPKALGSPWRDALAAVGAAMAAVTARFGTSGVIGPVTAWQVASASSGGRLLSPGWPMGSVSAGTNTSCP